MPDCLRLAAVASVPRQSGTEATEAGGILSAADSDSRIFLDMHLSHNLKAFDSTPERIREVGPGRPAFQASSESGFAGGAFPSRPDSDAPPLRRDGLEPGSALDPVDC